MSISPAHHDMDGMLLRRLVGSVGILAPSEDAALSYLHSAMRAHPQGSAELIRLAFCNAHVVNLAARDPQFRAALETMMVLPDGMGVDMGSRLIHGEAFPANLNGTDFMPKLITSSPRPLRIALLGAGEGVAARAGLALARLDPRHDITILGHGYFDEAGERLILARLAASPVDLLLVAFGNPKQELWITRKIGPEHARVAAGVGALFDFWAGEVVRAPIWLRRLRLEWLFRLCQEPGRLWRRYVMGNPAFLLRILRQKWRGGRP